MGIQRVCEDDVGESWNRKGLASGTRGVRHESSVLGTKKHLAMGINISFQRGRLASAGGVNA